MITSSPPARESLKLDANENLQGPAPAAVDAIAGAAPRAHLYPELRAETLRKALAEHLGVPETQVLLGNGSSALLLTIAHALVDRDGDAVLWPQHGFTVYGLAAASARASAVRVPEPDFERSLDAMLEQVRKTSPKLVFLDNPGNPTGSFLEAGPLKSFIKALPSETTLVLDEAYIEYVERQRRPASIDWLREHPNLIVLRTFSKAFGLAAMRIGYAVANEALVERIQARSLPYLLSEGAIAAGVQGLRRTAEVERQCAQAREVRAALAEGLHRLSLRVLPSAANFVTVGFKSAAEARSVREGLASEGIQVASLSNYELADFLRITVPALPIQAESIVGAVSHHRFASLQNPGDTA